MPRRRWRSGPHRERSPPALRSRSVLPLSLQVLLFRRSRRGGAGRRRRTSPRSSRRAPGGSEPGTPLSQLFVGGGTPTALHPELLDQVLAAIFDRMPLYGRHVHTVEASPETISPAHIEVLKRRGVGRVSMGIQSLDNAVLGAVHRRHSAEQALAACELLVGSGLIVNVDLIYGLPTRRRRASAGICGHRWTRGPVAHALQPAHQRAHPGSQGASRRGPIRSRRADAVAGVRRVRRDLGYTQTRWHTFKRLDTSARSTSASRISTTPGRATSSASA